MEPTPWLLSRHTRVMHGTGSAVTQRLSVRPQRTHGRGYLGHLHSRSCRSLTGHGHPAQSSPRHAQTMQHFWVSAFLHQLLTLWGRAARGPQPCRLSQDASSSRFPHTSTNTAPCRAPSNTVGPQTAAEHSLKGRENKKNQRGICAPRNTSSSPQAPASPPGNGQAAGKQDRAGHCDGKAQFPSPATLQREDSAEQEPTGRGIHPGTVTDTGDAATDAPSHPNATSPRSPECCRPPAGGVGCWIDEWFCGPRSSASPRWRRRSAPASPGEGESAAVSGGPTGTTTPNSTSTGHVPKPPQLQGLPSSMEGAALSLAWVAKAHRGKSSSPVRPPSCSPSPAPLRTPRYSPVMPQHTAH